MAEVKKVIIEEFNGEGDLIKRTTTEYDTETGRAEGGSVWPSRVGDIRPGDTYEGVLTSVTTPYDPKVWVWNIGGLGCWVD